MTMKGVLAGVSLTSLVLLTTLAPACGRESASRDIRERAYRANNRGVAQLERFSYPEAAEAFRQALQIDGTLAIAHVNLSLALIYAQDLAGAAREANEAAKLLPSAPQPHYVLGLIARAENRATDALQEFQRVRQIDPDDVGTNVNLGQIHLEQRQYRQAIEVLRPAANAEPSNVSAAYNLGLALTRDGQSEEGAKILARVQELRSTGYAVTFGTGYLEQGRYAEALASTGAEPDLVDESVPPTRFAASAIAKLAIRPADVESPFGRTVSAQELTAEGSRTIAAGLDGGLTLLDFDGDGDLDLFVAQAGGQRLFRNDGPDQWIDVTDGSGLTDLPAGSVPVGCVAGDFDNDARADLFVLRYGGSTIYHNDGNGRFSDVTKAAKLPLYPYLPGAAAMVDVDHDGDLDLVIAGLADLRPRPNGGGVFPRDFPPAPLQLLRNNGNGTFTDTTQATHIGALTHAVAIVPTDFDNRRDVDLLIVNRDSPPLLFQNLRDGTFRDVAAEVGLASTVGAGQEIVGVTAADVNKDDFPDFFFARTADGVFALSDGRGHFMAAVAPDGERASLAPQLVDYDNDGLFDLLTWSADGPRVFRDLGRRWSDVSRAAFPASGRPATPVSARGLALADLDGDGRTDLVAATSGGLDLWSAGSEPSQSRRSQRVVLKGRVSNRLGIGSKVQIRAGSLSGRIETSAATPAVAPSDVLFGLGDRPGADTVRVLWPSGTLQAETAGAAEASASTSAAPPTLPPSLIVEELDRKPSSCPFLYTWNGERFTFITDFMGGGEMGYWEAPGRRNVPDPVEYVRIDSEQLRPKDGRFEIRVTNELEETLYADRMQLLSIAHPSDVEIYPNEGMTDPPKTFRLFAVTHSRVPHATDDHGHDVTDSLARIDRRYPDDFDLEPFRGYAATHTLTFDLAPVTSPVLLMTAWTDYAFSSDNLAASQAGRALSVPSLQIQDAGGRWRTAIADIGIPVGRLQTIPIDLASHLRPGEHVVRIVTNMRIYWDRAIVATALPAESLPIATLDPLSATLRDRGFSSEVRPDRRDPPVYDYQRVSQASPWKSMPGRYTRLGNVRDLLTAADDMFVIAKPGDEISLSFDAAAANPLPPGWTRTYLLMADGFSKEMNINSASPDLVEPLPFHAMTGYPYGLSEHYPDTPEHQRYRATYNTRVIGRSVPRIETVESK
jgi:Tfp pilus assembly protein PilF